MRLIVLIYFLSTYLCLLTEGSELLKPPIVINTWNFTRANARAWIELEAGHSALDAIEHGCGQCEIDRCDGTVGWGGSPAESGETTLDAMIMDGETFEVGAVGGLRRVKGAIEAARFVLERTNHSLLVGEMATQFALSMGLKEESLKSNESREMHESWLRNNCQPNYWHNVSPDPRTSCGPYKPIPLPGNKAESVEYQVSTEAAYHQGEDPLIKGHDTIGMVALDSKLKLASGTSTNGLRHKILGRVGDSPVPGAGSYAAKGVGAAAATGDGDVIMRFLLSYQAVESLRRGLSAQMAASDAIGRLVEVYENQRPLPNAAMIVLSKDGSYGAACVGYKKFPYVISDRDNHVKSLVVDCKT